MDGQCFSNYKGLSAGWIVAIVLLSLAVLGGISFAIYTLWKRRKGFMGSADPDAQSGGLRATYY